MRRFKSSFILVLLAVGLLRVAESNVKVRDRNVRVKLGKCTRLQCDVDNSLKIATWVKTEGSDKPMLPNQKRFLASPTTDSLVYGIRNATRKANGTYECIAQDFERTFSESAYLFVTEAPEVKINFMISVGSGGVYLNWTVYDGNEPVRRYSIQKAESGTEEWEDAAMDISGSNVSYLVEGLKKSTLYRFRITAENSIGESKPAISQSVTTLEKDPDFVPKMEIKGTLENSVTIGWSPPKEHPDLVTYYNVSLTQKGETESSCLTTSESNYVFKDLKNNESYAMKVAACSDYAKKCGEWSAERETDVIDRYPKFIPAVYIVERGFTRLVIVWTTPPTELKGRVHQYKAMAKGNNGDSHGPVYIDGARNMNSHEFSSLEPYSLYNVTVAACSKFETQCGNWSDEITGATAETLLTKRKTYWVTGLIVAPVCIIAICAIIVFAYYTPVYYRERIWRLVERRIAIARRGAEPAPDQNQGENAQNIENLEPL